MYITCDGILEIVNHSANGFSVQSQDRGLSCNDRLCSSLAPFKAFFATIDISLPSNRNSLRDGKGAMRSLVNALNERNKGEGHSKLLIKVFLINLKKLCVKSKTSNFDR